MNKNKFDPENRILIAFKTNASLPLEMKSHFFIRSNNKKMFESFKLKKKEDKNRK